MVVGGADGCRTGWVVCRRDTDGTLDIRVVKTLAEACEGLSVLAVDMPIGFVDMPRPGRECEGQARKLLPGKASSVFPTPCRPVLACTTHAEANAANDAYRRGLAVRGGTMYLTKEPCEVCHGLLRDWGVIRVVWRDVTTGREGTIGFGQVVDTPR